MDLGTLMDCCDCFWWCIIADMPGINTNNNIVIYYFIKNKQLVGIWYIYIVGPDVDTALTICVS
jgi:hypothetical protein